MHRFVSFCSSVRHGGPGPLETDPVRAAARRNGVEVGSGSARRRLPSPPACSARKRVEVGFGSALAVGMPRDNFFLKRERSARHGDELGVHVLVERGVVYPAQRLDAEHRAANISAMAY